MNKEIFILPCSITVNKKLYKCEYNHELIHILEIITQKGFYELYEKFIYHDNLSKEDVISIIAVSVFKNHGTDGMNEVRDALTKNPHLSTDDFAHFRIYFKNLFPDLTKFNRDMDIYIDDKKNSLSSSFYNFEEVYALALNCLGWSDTEFWNATPRKLCFALSAKSKYNEEFEKHKERIQKKTSINLLNGIKSIL